MDGMTIGGGGGFELGGGYVTIAGDLTPLRDAVAEARSLTEGLVAHDFVLRPRLDLTDARNAMAELRAEFQQFMGVSGGGGIGGFASPAQLSPSIQPSASAGAEAFQVDPHRLAGLQSRYERMVTGQLAALDDAVADALDKAVDGMGGGPSAAAGGASARAGGRGRSQNPLSLRGASARLGIGIGGLVAGMEAVHLIGGIGQAFDVAASAQSQSLLGMDHFGSAIDPYSSSGLLAVTGRQAQLATYNATLGAVESLPFVGSLIGSLDFGQGSRRRQAQSLSREAAGIEYEMNRSDELGIELASTQGDASTAAQLRSERAMRIARADIGRARRGYSDAHRSFFGTVSNGSDDAIDLADENYDTEAAIQRALVAQAARQQIGGRQQIAGNIFAAGFHTIASGYQLQATQMLIAGGAGAQLASMQLERQALTDDQRGDRERFGGETSRLIGSAKPEDRERVQSERDAQFQELKAQQAAAASRADLRIIEAERGSQRELTTIQAEGEAARLRSMQDSFGAEMVIFEAAAQNKLAVARQTGQNLENIQALEGAIGAERAALYQGQIYAGQDVIAGAGLEISASNRTAAAAGLRMGGQGHAASLLSFQNEDDRIGRERERARRLPSLQQGIEMAKLDARQRANDAARSESEFGYRREGALMGFQLEGGAQIARDTIADMPMTARADEEVMRARMEADELILAHPERRAQIIATEQLKLDAIAHQQFGFRSGGIARSYGSLDEALLATGFGMDLGGDARDRRNAQNVLNNGRGQVGVPIPGTEPAADAMGAAAASLNDAANRLLRALTGVTLLTTGS